MAWRNARDATLSAPTLLFPSIQANIRAGKLPEAESNGVRYLKIPVTLDEPSALISTRQLRVTLTIGHNSFCWYMRCT